MAQADHGVLMRRRGFTAIEVLVAIIAVAIVAAVLIPAVLSRIGTARSSSLGQTLNSLNDAVQNYKADVRRYPYKIRYLTTAPTGTIKDLCNQNVPSDFLSRWSGPYLQRTTDTTGIRISDAVVRDSLELSPAGPYTATTNGGLVIVVQNVDSTIARTLELTFDSTSNYSAGTIRFTPGSGSQGTLRYLIPVRGC